MSDETPLNPADRARAGVDLAALTRATLSEAVYNQVGLSRADSSKLVESVLEHMSETLEGGQSVKISSFGSFIVRDKAERIGRNPRTGDEAPISARRVVVFKPSQILRARLNDEDEEGIEEEL